MRTYLKIKIKSLAAEASIIKLDERKAKAAYRGYAERKGQPAVPCAVFWGLKNHRLDVVRFECRASLLAYGFIRGRAYKSIEGKTHPMWDIIERRLWARVVKLAAKYGDGTATEATVDAWRSAE